MPHLSEKTMKIISNDLIKMKSDARKIIKVIEKCQQMVKTQPVDGDEWTKQMQAILDCDSFRYIIFDKRGRF
ncbi:MAG: hypothetical protein IMZ64_11860 [Bacteroidetes bacterium]|nr:hypothetical protein [Bacteroidota bacterium]